MATPAILFAASALPKLATPGSPQVWPIVTAKLTPLAGYTAPVLPAAPQFAANALPKPLALPAQLLATAAPKTQPRTAIM